MTETPPQQRGTRVPGFSVAMRGYDREQVQRYVSALHASSDAAVQFLQQTEQELASVRADLAGKEREMARLRAQPAAPTSDPAEAGDRISQLLRLATEEADAIRASAEADAVQVVAEAQAHGEGIIRSAESHGARIQEAADRLSKEQVQEAERQAAAELDARLAGQVEEANREVAALRQETAELAERRATLASVVKGLEDQRREAVSALGDVRQALERVLGGSGSGGTKSDRVVDLTSREGQPQKRRPEDAATA